MKRLLLVAGAIFCWGTGVNAASVQTDLRALADNHEVKVVWSRGTGGEFGFVNRYNTGQALVKFDTKTGREDTICWADSVDFSKKSNVTRPIISHDGLKVMYSNAYDSTIWTIGWDGKGKKRIAKGIAGCLWYDTATNKEYAIYSKNGSLECNNAIWRININDSTDAKEVLPKSVINATTNQLINTFWISVSKDGTNMVAGVGWPQISKFSLVTKTVTGGGGGCWPSIPYDNSYSMVIFVLDHNSWAVIPDSKSGKSDYTLIPNCPWNNKACPEGSLNFPKMSSNNPRFMSLIDSRSESSGQGPGNVMVFKFNATLDTFQGSVVVTPNNMPKDGFSDVWIGDTVSPSSINANVGINRTSILGNLNLVQGIQPTAILTLTSSARVSLEIVTAGGRSLLHAKGSFAAGTHEFPLVNQSGGLYKGCLVTRLNINGNQITSKLTTLR